MLMMNFAYEGPTNSYTERRNFLIDHAALNTATILLNLIAQVVSYGRLSKVSGLSSI